MIILTCTGEKSKLSIKFFSSAVRSGKSVRFSEALMSSISASKFSF